MTIVTIVTWLIMVFVGVVTVFCIFEEKDIKKQMNAALVLLPIVLRALMIKEEECHEEKLYFCTCSPGMCSCFLYYFW